MNRLDREQMAARVARDIPEGAYVNLGIGLPTTVANFLPPDKDIFLQSENGLLGMGPAPAKGAEDPELINAGKLPVSRWPPRIMALEELNPRPDTTPGALARLKPLFGPDGTVTAAYSR